MSKGSASRERWLIKNTGILALGTISSKVLTFLLLPVYTNILSTEDYGTVDVLMTIVTLSIPFITLQLFSAVFRFIIEEEGDKDQQRVIITTGILPAALNYAVSCGLVLLLNAFVPVPYCGLILLYFAANIVFEYAQCIMRGFGRNGLYSLMSFLMTLIILLSNIVMLLGLHMKGETILISNILAYFTMGIIVFIRLDLKDYVRFSAFSLPRLKEMLHYSVPLIPNTISWWVANTSDRLVITFVMGAGANGIYAAANKIPNIYTTVFNVFNIAWSESLSRGVKDPGQEQFIAQMFNKCFRLFGCMNIGLICVISLIFNVLIGPKYTDAYPQVFILILAIFINSICSLYGGLFDAYKRSSVTGMTTVVGAVVNLAVNLSLIHFIGLYAASLSTLVSYIVILFCRKHYADKIIRIHWPMGFILQAALMLALVGTGYFLKHTVLNVFILCLTALWAYWVNREMINDTLNAALGKFFRR